MASPNFLNLARMSSTTTGTGTVTCAGAVAGFLTFAAAGAVDGLTYAYAIFDNAGGSEIGRGVMGGSGTTLTRSDVRASTNGNAALNLSGSQEVYITPLAADIVIPSSTVVFTLRATAPEGWLLFNDQTIGDGSSGATFASVDAQTVFTDLYAAADADCPILTSAGGATTRGAQGSAAAAWAAHCRMTMPKALGRALAVAGAGSGLTSRALGSKVGEETHTPTLSEMFNHNHTLNLASHIGVGSGDNGGGGSGDSSPNTPASQTGWPPSIANSGSSTPFNVVDPRVHLNCMVKL